MLKDRNIAFDLEIAGDGPMQSELQALVSDGDLAEAGAFQGAAGASSRFRSWLQGLDMFVLACKKDRNGDNGRHSGGLDGSHAGGCARDFLPDFGNSGTHRRRSKRSTGRAGKSRRTRPVPLPGCCPMTIFRTIFEPNAMATVQAEFELSKNVAVLDKLFREVIQ